jgi:hypothetical protein
MNGEPIGTELSRKFQPFPKTRSVMSSVEHKNEHSFEKGQDNVNEMTFENEANIPGAAGVIRCHGGAGFYCTVHKHEIQPLLYEVDGDEIPCCEECMLEEMVAEGREVKTPVPIVDPVTAAVGDNTDTSGVPWECLT